MSLREPMNYRTNLHKDADLHTIFAESEERPAGSLASFCSRTIKQIILALPTTSLSQYDQEFIWSWLNIGLCELNSGGSLNNFYVHVERARLGLPKEGLCDRPSDPAVLAGLDGLLAFIEARVGLSPSAPREPAASLCDPEIANSHGTMIAEELFIAVEQRRNLSAARPKHLNATAYVPSVSPTIKPTNMASADDAAALPTPCQTTETLLPPLPTPHNQGLYGVGSGGRRKTGEKTGDGLRITERDIEIIKRINGFGYMKVESLAGWLRTDFSSAARRVRALIEAGLLERKTVKFGSPVLVATMAGAEYCNDGLRPVSSVGLSTFRHTILLADLANSLEKKFGQPFLPERRLDAAYRIERGCVPTHLPDGHIQTEPGLPTGIELELTAKSVARTRDIFMAHMADQSIARVHYFAIDESVGAHLIRCGKGFDRIYVKKWKPKRAI